MAKIHSPQDQNGVGLINQTFFNVEKEALHSQITTETKSRLDAVDKLEAADAELKAAVDKLRSDTAADLKDAVDKLEAADATLRSDIAADLETAADELRSDAATKLKAAVDKLRSDTAADLKDAVDKLEAADAVLEDTVDGLAGTVDGLAGTVDGLTGTVSELEAADATEKARAMDAEFALDEKIEVEINKAVDSLNATDSSLNNSIIALKNHGVTISNAVLRVENAAAQGFSFVAPMSGNISNIKVHCRTSGVIQGDSSSLVVYTTEKLTESLNEQTHNRNAILDFTFDSFAAVAGEKYRCIFEKDGAKINSCISTTPIGIYNSTDSIFQGKIQNANIQDHSGANVNAIFEIVYADAKLNEILSLCIKNNISSLGHIDNNTKHITSSERKTWNDKATTQSVSALGTKVDEVIDTISTDLATKAEIANFVTAEIVDEKIAAFEHHKPIFDINRDVDKVTFNLASSAEPQTVVLTLSEGKIFAGTVVASSSAISASLSTINPGVDTSFNVNIGLQETPTESGMAFVIVDTICDSAEYDNAQHVAEVIPVEIIVAAEA